MRAHGCMSCHRIGERGGNAGPDLSVVGLRHSREWLERWLKDPRAWKHDTAMPNFRLSDGSRSAIVDYLASLRGRDYIKESAHGDPLERGRRIYLRAGCVACHGAGGRGGHPNNNVAGGRIPALDRVAEGFSPEELEQRIRRGRRPDKEDPRGPDPLVAMPAWGALLSDAEIKDVSAYVSSLNTGARQDW